LDAPNATGRRVIDMEIDMEDELISGIGRRGDADERLDALATIVERQQVQIRWLHTAIKAVSRSTGVVVSGPCAKCSVGVMLERDGLISCTRCGTRCYVG
jgi:hypothetical protein